VIEVEMKFRTPDWQPILAILEAWHAVAEPIREDTDHYFNAPDRDFAQTDEAVRIRRIGTSNILTYKGPKFDTQTKARTEIEVDLAEGSQTAADAVRFLSALGYRPVAVVSKMRHVYKFTRNGFEIQACLDDVGACGKFVELEILAEQSEFETAKAILLRTAAELNLVEQERRSYLRMLLEQTATRTPPPPKRS
jgi:adenylate cyclase, class 2